MIKLLRTQNNPYKWETGLEDLRNIANVVHIIPRDWITQDGFLPNEKLIEYAQPLIEGEVKIPHEGGLPKYAVLEKNRVEKKLPPRG
jgi:6-phosphofructokinase 1